MNGDLVVVEIGGQTRRPRRANILAGEKQR